MITDCFRYLGMFQKLKNIENFNTEGYSETNDSW